ncbi:hypothetical protein HAX54_048370 [Datura stramonium]|uniref:Uncharacterized protein n=1 Tax=Datura stramonium TaxID=4076 RepID=A0ABS8STL8_DATST|nr:hypothetical protein [Datura stramonium]
MPDPPVANKESVPHKVKYDPCGDVTIIAEVEAVEQPVSIPFLFLFVAVRMQSQLLSQFASLGLEEEEEEETDLRAAKTDEEAVAMAEEEERRPNLQIESVLVAK